MPASRRRRAPAYAAATVIDARLRFASSLLLLVACGDAASPMGGSSSEGTGSSGATLTTSTSAASTVAGTTGTVDSSDSGGGPTTGDTSGSSGGPPIDMGVQPVDPCTETAFCEDFEDYTEVALADGQEFGPWRAALSSGGALMDLDGTHTVSGDHALHVVLDQGTESGGRLFTNGDVPILADTPTHVYGRMMMYIAQNGTSVHWTFFGVSGEAEASSPLAGNYASYIMSSLPRDGVNTYSFVDGLSGGPYYQDCWSQGMQPMPTDAWTCVSFEMDTLGRHLRMYNDADPTPIVSVDETGQGCVSPAPGDSTWWGPEIDTFFVGGWSFHEMNAPLELWIDDVVFDTAPVACP